MLLQDLQLFTQKDLNILNNGYIYIEIDYEDTALNKKYSGINDPYIYKLSLETNGNTLIEENGEFYIPLIVCPDKDIPILKRLVNSKEGRLIINSYPE